MKHFVHPERNLVTTAETVINEVPSSQGTQNYWDRIPGRGQDSWAEGRKAGLCDSGEPFPSGCLMREVGTMTVLLPQVDTVNAPIARGLLGVRGQWSAAAPGSWRWEGACALEGQILTPCAVMGSEAGQTPAWASIPEAWCPGQ